MTRGLDRVYNFDRLEEAGFERILAEVESASWIQHRVTVCATGQAVSIA